ncbi:MAG: hypothetical protein QXW47_02665 [Candidatus Jordarchaeales archaeon]|nr:hypothetical protein [Candidatus Jordarchaeia archaeon]
MTVSLLYLLASYVLANQMCIVRTSNGYFYTGALIVVAMTFVLLAYLLRKGERGAAWVFLMASIAWTTVEVYIALSGIRAVNPLMLMGGVWLPTWVPAVIRGITDGALPALLGYLFARTLNLKNYTASLLILLFTLAFLGIERSVESIGVAAGVLHPSMGLLGIPVWNSTYSIRWIFNPVSVGGLLVMTLIGLALLMRINGRGFWVFTTHYFLYIVYYALCFILIPQQFGFRRWVGVPLPFAGFDPEIMSITLLDPAQSLIRSLWLGYGLPIIIPFYHTAIPILVLFPADLFGASVTYLFDATIEIAGVYIPYLTIPVALRLVEKPENGTSTISLMLHATILLSLTVGPITMALWLSASSMNFLPNLLEGAATGPVSLLVGVAVLAVTRYLTEKTRKKRNTEKDKGKQ